MASKKAEALFKVTASQTPWDQTGRVANVVEIAGQRAPGM